MLKYICGGIGLTSIGLGLQQYITVLQPYSLCFIFGGIFIFFIPFLNRIFYNKPHLALLKFHESPSQNNLNFEIVSNISDSLLDHIILKYAFEGNRSYIQLPITNRDTSIQPNKPKLFNVDCSSLDRFPFLLFRKYKIKSNRGKNISLYFRRASNLKGSRISILRYYFELYQYLWFGKLKDNYT